MVTDINDINVWCTVSTRVHGHGWSFNVLMEAARIPFFCLTNHEPPILLNRTGEICENIVQLARSRAVRFFAPVRFKF
jgi:predicted TIM-barrel fold metal-dependent hydrolase